MESELEKENPLCMPNPRWTHDRKLAKEQLGVVGVDEAVGDALAGSGGGGSGDHTSIIFQ